MLQIDYDDAMVLSYLLLGIIHNMLNSLIIFITGGVVAAFIYGLAMNRTESKNALLGVFCF